jgi:hypothetical protein
MHTDLKYLKSQSNYFDSLHNQLKRKSNTKTIAFGNFTWFGFLDGVAPSSVPEGYGLVSFNNNPNGSALESPLGYREIGSHDQNEIPIDLNEWEGLLVGKFVPADQNINLKKDTGLFKILKHRSTQETNFWLLEEDGRWRIRNPISTYWKDGKVNPEASVSDVYNFKGSRFAYTVWKNILYICSGEENFNGSGGVSGLMKFDGNNWDSVLTGDAGFLTNKNTYVNKTIYNKDGALRDTKIRLYDSGRDFNPSLVCTFKQRLYIAGAKANQLQVKMSERENPDNFIENVLSIPSVPLSTKDTSRSSSFILSEGGDFITSMNVYNDSIYIGTNKKFYIYNLLDSQLQDGSFFQIDAIQENNFTPAGPRSSYATTTFANRLFYVSDYQVIPEISCFELEYNSSTGIPTAMYKRLSDEIEDFLPDFEIGNATIGVFGDKILIGLKRKPTFTDIEDSVGNDICLVASPFNFSRNDQRIGFTVLDYIAPSIFYTDNSGCYFATKDSGRIYKITDNYRGVENETMEEGGEPIEYPVAVWKTGWTGYNPAKDSAFSLKTLKNILISGYFAENTEMYITLQPETFCDKEGEKACNKTYTMKYTFDKKDLITCEDKFEDINNYIGYKNKAPYYGTMMFAIPEGTNTIQYKKISYSIEMVNSRYFLLESITFIAGETSRTNNDIIKADFKVS